MQLIISYLAADRLGELEGLTASDISPMHDLAPGIAEMKKSIEPQVLEKLDGLLSEQRLVTNENGIIKAAPEMSGFLKSLFQPQKCFHTRINEPEGCSATYYIPFDGAWIRLDAVRGQLNITFPLSERGADICLAADIRTALKDENIKLLAERRETDSLHGAVVMNDEKGYAFVGSVINKKEHACTEYVHSEKRSYKKALKGFLIALAVNVCAAVIIAVLKTVL